MQVTEPRSKALLALTLRVTLIAALLPAGAAAQTYVVPDTVWACVSLDDLKDVVKFQRSGDNAAAEALSVRGACTRGGFRSFGRIGSPRIMRIVQTSGPLGLGRFVEIEALDGKAVPPVRDDGFGYLRVWVQKDDLVERSTTAP